jgi:hypothetical protein
LLVFVTTTTTTTDSTQQGVTPLLVHPSGPPSDALDSLSDSIQESLSDFNEVKERAKKHFSAFFAEKKSVPPKADEQKETPTIATTPTPTTTTSTSTSPRSTNSASSLDDWKSKASSWWKSVTAPPPTVEKKEEHPDNET